MIQKMFGSQCKSFKIKRIVCIIVILMGVLVGFFTHFISSNTAFTPSYLYGISTGFVTVGIGFLITQTLRARNPKHRKEDAINEQDERLIMISMYAMSTTYLYLLYGIVIAFVINLLIPLSLHYTLFFFIISSSIIQMFAYKYYNKKY